MTNRTAQGWVPIGRLALRVAISVTIAAMIAGCSWFRRDEAGPSQPIADASPMANSGDAPGLGSYPREGILNSSAGESPRTSPGERTGRPITPALASTQPVTVPEYLVLGSVVANVNGEPVYAHDLVRQVAPVLRARARELPLEQFRQVALRELTRQRGTLIRDELEYAAAQRNTTPEEVRDAQARTYAFRERLISQAGGSEQVARARLSSEGEDFDKLLKNEERRQLVRLYYNKKIFPRVTVTVDEMRRYFEQNRASRFTVPAQGTIRLIRIDAKDVGSESAALERINEARRRASAGENFDALSDEYNKMPVLLTNKGKLGPITRGAYAISQVDDAIWQTDVGKVTPVIKVGDAFYIALVVDRTDGRTMAFDEQEVQTAINAALRESKMMELQQKQREALMTDAVIQADDAMLQPVVEMAMQLYPSWRAGTGG